MNTKIRTTIFIASLLMTMSLYSQDTIKTVSGNKIISKVIEINQSEVKYKRFNNLEGPKYVLNREDIESITYINGLTEVFNKVDNNTFMAVKENSNNNSELDINNLFYKNTNRGKKVFINAVDKNGIIHATKTLKRWNYWIITTNKNEADFVLNFVYNFGALGDAFGYAQFVDPKTGLVLKTTKEVNTLMSMDINTKRGVINKLIKKQIKPLFY